MTVEKFAASISLLFVEIGSASAYCEYEDGELFGGHRIHAYFDEEYRLISADI
ncbi:hypothetical protein [Saccharibacillus kuerlensis]|uniref:Uncharacterized protein n=1 Tax=Saccharibacillus kuerlensis TaxID=459527 RepID=A0ABQ2LAC3_9BACL|nr:hypothetical protein [Saccharibacillus kuerlensis]GGO08388.1 hypothetical protein GCM10010969_37840 [Saccharibacillus kuerlensis]